MSDPSINFGPGKKVEYKNNNAIKGDAFKAPENANEQDVTIWQNKQALSKMFDRNGDNILDTNEIAKMQNYINRMAGKNITKYEMSLLAKNLSRQAKEAGNTELADQLSKLTRDDLYNFTKQIAENTDNSIQTTWEGNKLTVIENGKTTISEYSDDAHKKLAQQMVEENDEKLTTTFNEEGQVTSKTRQKGTVTEFLDPESSLVLSKEIDLGNGVKKSEEYEYPEGGDKPSKVTITDANGQKTIREYAEDRSYG